MAENSDFDFHLGKGRRCQGRGWRGLLALTLLLAALVLAALFANQAGVGIAAEIANFFRR